MTPNVAVILDRDVVAHDATPTLKLGSLSTLRVLHSDAINAGRTSSRCAQPCVTVSSSRSKISKCRDDGYCCQLEKSSLTLVHERAPSLARTRIDYSKNLMG